MGLLDNGLLGGNLANEIGASTEAAKSGADTYRKPLSPSSFDSFGAGSLTQGEEKEIARLETGSGLERRWGYGRADQAENQGYVYGHLKNASGENIYGMLIFMWENSTGRQTEVAEEIPAQDIDTADRYNRDSQPPLPEKQDKNKAEQDEFLVVRFIPDTDPADITNSYSIDKGASEARWPATEYDVST